jgi:hypothetical protein
MFILRRRCVLWMPSVHHVRYPFILHHGSHPVATIIVMVPCPNIMHGTVLKTKRTPWLWLDMIVVSVVQVTRGH